jgi:acyl transferase domain-containing protein
MRGHTVPDVKAAPGLGDGIAIVGLGLRLPKSESLDEFWSHLAAGRSLITDVPERRWDAAAVHGDPARGQFSNSVRGGFVEDADCFDPAFFNISPREAAWMDPQQRFALELAWKAIEDAGYPARALAGSRTGVYVGVCHWDYAELLEKHLRHLDAYTPTGIAFSIIANRISHFFDLRGPSLANDTACAASLTSVYEAVRALQTGECDLALAGGVNLTWSPNHFIAFSKNGMLSREGASRAFDQRADGYVRGEGGAMLLLKPLARALEDGDPIHAVIRGVGVNHGGRTNSLTVTNPQAQGELIADVMRQAAVAPDSIDYIEAHGTGTPLGDPIEIAGLKQAFARLHKDAGSTQAAGTCLVGSVKTNIGHLEGAAGVAGIAKVLAALRHARLPANVDFGQLNALIKLDASPFRIAGQSQAWPRSPQRPRRAGVSAFGFGGSNAHVVLEEAPAREAAPAYQGMVLLPLSARDPQRLVAGASSLLQFLRQWPHEALADLAWTLQTGREVMESRVAFLVANAAALEQALESFIAGKSDMRVLIPGAAADPTEPSGLLAQCAKRWLAGGEVDWASLYAGSEGQMPRRIHAPGYSFARERHWMDLSQGLKDATPVLHPLLHRNASRLAEQCYQSTFSGAEFFWAEHRVGAEQVLPGVVCLEMARAAWEHATASSRQASLSLCFEGLVWARAIRAAEAPTAVELRLLPRNGHTLAFEIAGGGPARVANAQGSLRPASAGAAAPLTRDIERLRAGSFGVIEAATLYQRLRASGMHHGTSFQAVTRVWQGDGYLLANLKLPRRLRSTLELFPLHPVLLDAAIQAWVGFETDDGALRGAAVPFACERIEVSGPCEESMWALLTPVAATLVDATVKRFDIALCDLQGGVRVHFQSLALRTMVEKDAAYALVHSIAHWQPQTIEVPATREPVELRIVAAGLEPALCDALAALSTSAVHALPAWTGPLDRAALALQWFKHLREDIAVRLHAGSLHRQQWLVLVPADLPPSLTAPLASLLRTANAEQPRVGVGRRRRGAGRWPADGATAGGHRRRRVAAQRGLHTHSI